MKRLPAEVARQVRTLPKAASWIAARTSWHSATAEPARRICCAHRAGADSLSERRVYFSTCSLLVQELLIAKRDLKLSRVSEATGQGFDALVIDDIGYVQQSREEMEVLFTLLAERYERGSVMLTSNLPFSKWEAIFKDPMTTAAAIDRLVHHSVIVELNIRELPTRGGQEVEGPLRRTANERRTYVERYERAPLPRRRGVGSTPVGAAPSFRRAHNLPGILVVVKAEGCLSPNNVRIRSTAYPRQVTLNRYIIVPDTTDDVSTPSLVSFRPKRTAIYHSSYLPLFVASSLPSCPVFRRVRDRYIRQPSFDKRRTTCFTL